MCIAIVKPIGVDVPSENILKNCFENNKDGAGFAFNYNGRVIIKKGFMRFEDFMNAFNSYNSKYSFKDRGLLIHFRIATHGGVNQSMTHPFPIQGDNGALQKIEYVSNYAVIHNGTISLTSSKANRENNMSDTAVFIRDYLYDIATNKDWFNNETNIDLIEKLIDSKMAILNNKGEFIKTSGFTEDNGVFYSNTSYKDNYFRHKKSSTYYDYYNDYYLLEDGYTSTPKKSNKNNIVEIKNKTIALMEIPVGYTIDYSGFNEVVPDEETTGFYIDKKNNLYYGFLDEEHLDVSKDAKPFYMDFYFAADNVSVYDTATKKVEFEPSFAAYIDQFPEM